MLAPQFFLLAGFLAYGTLTNILALGSSNSITAPNLLIFLIYLGPLRATALNMSSVKSSVVSKPFLSKSRWVLSSAASAFASYCSSDISGAPCLAASSSSSSPAIDFSSGAPSVFSSPLPSPSSPSPLLPPPPPPPFLPVALV
jgi:hypothetical protein